MDSENTNNLFQEVLNDSGEVEKRLLGQDYPYYKNIKVPRDIGMSSAGTLPALARDVNGLIQYVQLLVSGNSSASKTGKPLGNKFFLQTGAKCLDKETASVVDRYIYINNVPQGNIPIVSSGLGVNFTDFKGLIPGTLGNLNVFNPYNIMRSFLTGATPVCQEITMETIDSNNNKSSETHYVTLVDIQNMDPCSFKDRKNPVNGKKCKEAFQIIYPYKYQNAFNSAIQELKMPTDPLVQLYFASLSILGIYILYRFNQSK